MKQAEVLRAAEAAVVQLSIELHYLAGYVLDQAIAAHLRLAAGALNDLAHELRALAGVVECRH